MRVIRTTAIRFPWIGLERPEQELLGIVECDAP
jgi:hypothetical protein